jgi:uncharacterized membrane protein YdjX (TVP38/TMEM64 family)
MGVFSSAESRRRVVVHLTVLAAALAVGYLLARQHLSFLRTPEAFRAWLLSFGPWAPVVFVVVQTAQVVAAPVPGQVVGVASGYVFGLWAGTLYSMVGTVLGTTLAFALARRYGRSYVERVLSAGTLARFDAVVADDGRLALFVLFLIPGPPDDAICFLAGITTIPVWQLVGIAILGRLPSVFLLNLAGAQLASEGVAVASAILVGVLVATAVFYRERERILAFLERRTGGQRVE